MKRTSKGNKTARKPKYGLGRNRMIAHNLRYDVARVEEKLKNISENISTARKEGKRAHRQTIGIALFAMIYSTAQNKEWDEQWGDIIGRWAIIIWDAIRFYAKNILDAALPYTIIVYKWVVGVFV